MSSQKNSSPQNAGTRLASLRALAKLAGVNNQELCLSAGRTPVALYRWFREDDIKMSNLALLTERCGYVVYAGLSKGNVIDPDILTPVTVLKPLQFVLRSLEYYGYTRETAAEKAGIPLSTFNGWMYKEQCTMGDIINFANKLGMTMFVEYKKRQVFNNVPLSGGLYATIDGLQFYSK